MKAVNLSLNFFENWNVNKKTNFSSSFLYAMRAVSLFINE